MNKKEIQHIIDKGEGLTIEFKTAKNANRARLNGMLIPGEFEPFSKNPSIAKFFVQMAKEIGMSKRKILDNINKLRDKNIIARVGNTKSGYWKILKEI